MEAPDYLNSYAVRQLNEHGYGRKKPGSERAKKFTSTEFVVDSDSEAEANDGSNSGIKQNLKRKAIETSDSVHLKKGKFSDDSRDSQAIGNSNGNTNGDSVEKAQESRAWLEDLSDSEPEKNESGDSNGTSHATETQRVQALSESQKQKFNLELSSDSDDAGSEVMEEDDHSDDVSESSASSRRISAQAETAVVLPVANGNTTPLSFQPPEDFAIPSIGTESTAVTRDLFSAENLEGKEIWHLTVPASLSIGDIQKFTKADMMSRKAVLKHQGNDYGFNIESRSGATSRVFVPSSNGSKYQPVTTRVRQTLHLRQITNIPNANSRSDSGKTNTISGARKTKLEQPKGLKLGYPPIGDVDAEHNRQNAIKQAKQRIENSKIEPQTEPSSKPKKSKKAKISSSEPATMSEWVDPQSYSAPVVVGSASQHTVEFPPEPGPSMDTEMANGIDERQADIEDPEAKARRKAEKAARKAARKAAKQEHKHGITSQN